MSNIRDEFKGETNGETKNNNDIDSILKEGDKRSNLKGIFQDGSPDFFDDFFNDFITDVPTDDNGFISIEEEALKKLGLSSKSLTRKSDSSLVTCQISTLEPINSENIKYAEKLKLSANNYINIDQDNVRIPLIYSVVGEGDSAKLQLLINLGADLTLKPKGNNTPLDPTSEFNISIFEFAALQNGKGALQIIDSLLKQAEKQKAGITKQFLLNLLENEALQKDSTLFKKLFDKHSKIMKELFTSLTTDEIVKYKPVLESVSLYTPKSKAQADKEFASHIDSIIKEAFKNFKKQPAAEKDFKAAFTKAIEGYNLQGKLGIPEDLYKDFESGAIKYVNRTVGKLGVQGKTVENTKNFATAIASSYRSDMVGTWGKYEATLAALKKDTAKMPDDVKRNFHCLKEKLISSLKQEFVETLKPKGSGDGTKLDIILNALSYKIMEGLFQEGFPLLTNQPDKVFEIITSSDAWKNLNLRKFFETHVELIDEHNNISPKAIIFDKEHGTMDDFVKILIDENRHKKPSAEVPNPLDLTKAQLSLANKYTLAYDSGILYQPKESIISLIEFAKDNSKAEELLKKLPKSPSLETKATTSPAAVTLQAGETKAKPSQAVTLETKGVKTKPSKEKPVAKPAPVTEKSLKPLKTETKTEVKHSLPIYSTNQTQSDFTKLNKKSTGKSASETVKHRGYTTQLKYSSASLSPKGLKQQVKALARREFGYDPNKSDIIGELFASALSQEFLPKINDGPERSPEVFPALHNETKSILIASKYLNAGSKRYVSMDFDNLSTAIYINPENKHPLVVNSETETKRTDILKLGHTHKAKIGEKVVDVTVDKRQLCDILAVSLALGDHDLNPGNLFLTYDTITGKSHLGRIDYGHAFNDLIKNWGPKALHTPKVDNIEERGFCLDSLNRAAVNGSPSKFLTNFQGLIPDIEFANALRRHEEASKKIDSAIFKMKDHIDKIYATEDEHVIKQLQEAMGTLLEKMGKPFVEYTESEKLLLLNATTDKESIWAKRNILINRVLNEVRGFVETNLEEQMSLGNVMEVQVIVDKMLTGKATPEDMLKVKELYDSDKRYLKGGLDKPIEWIRISKEAGIFSGNLQEYIQYRHNLLKAEERVGLVRPGKAIADIQDVFVEGRENYTGAMPAGIPKTLLRNFAIGSKTGQLLVEDKLPIYKYNLATLNLDSIDDNTFKNFTSLNSIPITDEKPQDPAIRKDIIYKLIKSEIAGNLTSLKKLDQSNQVIKDMTKSVQQAAINFNLRAGINPNEIMGKKDATPDFGVVNHALESAKRGGIDKLRYTYKLTDAIELLRARNIEICNLDKAKAAADGNFAPTNLLNYQNNLENILRAKNKGAKAACFLEGEVFIGREEMDKSRGEGLPKNSDYIQSISEKLAANIILEMGYSKGKSYLEKMGEKYLSSPQNVLDKLSSLKNEKGSKEEIVTRIANFAKMAQQNPALACIKDGDGNTALYYMAKLCNKLGQESIDNPLVKDSLQKVTNVIEKHTDSEFLEEIIIGRRGISGSSLDEISGKNSISFDYFLVPSLALSPKKQRPFAYKLEILEELVETLQISNGNNVKRLVSVLSDVLLSAEKDKIFTRKDDLGKAQEQQLAKVVTNFLGKIHDHQGPVTIAEQMNGRLFTPMVTLNGGQAIASHVSDKTLEALSKTPAHDWFGKLARSFKVVKSGVATIERPELDKLQPRTEAEKAEAARKAAREAVRLESIQDIGEEIAKPKPDLAVINDAIRKGGEHSLTHAKNELGQKLAAKGQVIFDYIECSDNWSKKGLSGDLQQNFEKMIKAKDGQGIVVLGQIFIDPKSPDKNSANQTIERALGELAVDMGIGIIAQMGYEKGKKFLSQVEKEHPKAFKINEVLARVNFLDGAKSSPNKADYLEKIAQLVSQTPALALTTNAKGESLFVQIAKLSGDLNKKAGGYNAGSPANKAITTAVTEAVTAVIKAALKQGDKGKKFLEKEILAKGKPESLKKLAGKNWVSGGDLYNLYIDVSILEKSAPLNREKMEEDSRQEEKQERFDALRGITGLSHEQALLSTSISEKTKGRIPQTGVPPKDAGDPRKAVSKSTGAKTTGKEGSIDITKDLSKALPGHNDGHAVGGQQGQVGKEK